MVLSRQKRRMPWWGSVALCLLIAACGVTPQMARTVNATSIRQVKIGMSERQVEGILGPPIRVRPWGPDSTLHDYAVRGALGQGIAVWIHVKQHAVAEVQVTQ